MDYYGKGAKCAPAGERYFGIHSPDDLFAYLKKIWKKDTCAPRMRKDWSARNMTCGQCSVTAFLAREIFGGRVLAVVLEDGNKHCYNEVNGTIFDLTSDQFKGKSIAYDLKNEQNIGDRLAVKEWATRYALLKTRLSNATRIEQVFADNGLIDGDILSTLKKLADEEYRDFASALVPNIPKERFLGVRSPELKRLAKIVSGSASASKFVSALPHRYQEENILHAYLINAQKSFDECVAMLDNFLPYIDNWAVCDVIAPDVFLKNKKRLLPLVKKWTDCGKTYHVRYAVGVLMRYFLGDDYSDGQMEAVAAIRSEEYYVNMMSAWYFATALAKNYDRAIGFIESGELSDFVQKKAIEKAMESFRITDERKAYLKTLKRK